jgi:signal transduction histidine kinase
MDRMPFRLPQGAKGGYEAAEFHWYCIQRAATGPCPWERLIIAMVSRADQTDTSELKRLLAERTAERDEALAHRAAASEVLQVVGHSMADAQPVFERIVDSIERLLDHKQIAIYLTPGDGLLHMAARRGTNVELMDRIYPRLVEQTAAPAVIEARQQLYIADALHGTDVPDSIRAVAKAVGNYSDVLTPLLWEGRGVGLIAVTREPNVPFSERELSLLRTFADQAVIAIENARLSSETREALERQTATADVLKVIASSPSNLEPVFEAIAKRSNRLLDGHSTAVWRFVEDLSHLVAFTSTDPVGDRALRALSPLRMGQNPALDAIRRSEVVHIPDTESIQLSMPKDGADVVRDVARARGYRSQLMAPLVSEGKAVGWISITRREPGGFAPKDVQLLRTFADQAVIAIENARLFSEVQAKTRDLEESLQQQTATAEVLQIISSSPSDLAPVFDNMLENATRVCGAEFGSMNLLEDDFARQVALYNAPVAFAAARVNKVYRPHPQSSLGIAIHTKQVVHVADLRTTAAYREHWPNTVELVDLGGARTVVVVPLLREDEVIGVITIFRQEIRPFEDKQIELVRNFARQAVIAIENARLLGELRQRTADLSKSLDDLRKAQDRLVQTEKLASLGQLTAGIAHEIKNPLNFVNNFSALSLELTDELNEVLEQATLADKVRTDVHELTGLLKDNLDKVVQHGKRADSIVKNMLLHSREGSGERRSADINALVGESLNLAYHGARAEKPGFTITLKHDLDPNAGALDLYPQEITRALLNLISNGFYAATRRKIELGDEAFEPLLSAATRDLGETVEIRIRDNGTGISSEVKAKMFNPFFTTKPTGEGTGLGLSMTHDIIVKQHGGRIDVNTEPGAFTEFIIILPRDNGAVVREKSE